MGAPSTASSRGEPSATQSAVLQQSLLHGFGVLAESHPISLPSLHGGEGSSFSDLVLPDDMVD